MELWKSYTCHLYSQCFISSASTFNFYYFRSLFIDLLCMCVGVDAIAYGWRLEDNLLGLVLSLHSVSQSNSG